MRIPKFFQSKLGWKLFFIFIFLALIVIGVFYASESIRESKVGLVLKFILSLPFVISLPILSVSRCSDLGCLLFGIIVVIISIPMFYGGFGYIIGYAIERFIKK